MNQKVNYDCINCAAQYIPSKTAWEIEKMKHTINPAEVSLWFGKREKYDKNMCLQPKNNSLFSV